MADLARRAMLAAAGLLALMPFAAQAAPAKTPAPDPDAELRDLFARWEIAAERSRRAELALDEAGTRYVEPFVPDALFAKPRDRSFFGHVSTSYRLTQRRWYGPRSIDWLRQYRAEVGPYHFITPDGRTITAPAVVDQLARERRDEILAAYDRWRAEEDAARKSAGLDLAEVEDTQATEANCQLRMAIILAPAHTLQGMLLKARVLGWCHGTHAEMTARKAEFVDEGHCSDETVAWSIGCDLVAMVERDAA